MVAAVRAIGYLCKMKSLWRLNSYFLKYRNKLILGICFVIISNLFGILPPQIIRKSVDLIVSNIDLIKNSSGEEVQSLKGELGLQLLWFGLLVLLLSLLKGVFMYFMRQTIIVMSRWIEFDLKNDLYTKYQTLTASFFKKYPTGDLMSRVSEDVGKVRMYIGPAIMYGINLVVLFVFVIAVMLQVNVKLTLYVLLPLPILSVTIYHVNNIILQRSTAIQEQLAKLTSLSQESFAGIRVLKSYGLERRFADIFQNDLRLFKNKSLAMARADALFFPLTLLLIGLSTILTIYVGGLEVKAGRLTAGNIAEFVIYVNMLTWPVTSVGWVASIIQQAAASQKRINEILDTEPDFDAQRGLEVNLDGGLSFDDVTFFYPGSKVAALKNISFELKPGQTLGIVGRTGSGKSTLAQLIARAYDPQSGVIKASGQDIKSFNVSHYRGQMGYVPQDVFLFSDTIYNNIAFGNSQSSSDQIQKAANLASLESTFTNLPDGIHTLLGERGVTLSGGQKQRVSIARAILRNPKMYVIDDCLSALDAQTEQAILQNLLRVTEGVSTVIISHRISSVVNADLILVLEHGEIVERGTHQELVDRKGFYANIHARQSQQEQAKEV